MRSAYRGRAAAYEKQGDHAKALADHSMNVTYLAIELEVLGEVDGADRARVLTEAAEAYRARSKCLDVLGKRDAAERDRDRAKELQAQLKQPAEDAVAKDRVRIINAWSSPVSVVIDGVTHRIDAGARKEIPLAATSVTCQVQAGPYLQTATFRAGKSYTIR
jgi:tetratricopeptide (TPR) repeat protein